MNFDIEYAKKVVMMESAAIAGLVKVVDDNFIAAAKLIRQTKGSVIVTGVGKAGIIGKKISATLASTGTASHFLHPTEGVHGDLGRIQTCDIVLALSYSGQSDEIVRLINPLKQRQIKIIAMTGKLQSSLAQHADVVICVGELTEACPLGIAPSVSTTCMLAMGDALAFMVMKSRDFTAEDYARFHPGGAIGARLITVGQSMMFKKDEHLPVVNSGKSVQEMLRQTEAIKRRGAVMIVNDTNELIGIITDADLRRALAEKEQKVMGLSVTELMTPEPKKVTEDTLASEAMAIFHKYRIDELPVVNDKNEPVGLIDVQDIVAIKIVN